MANLQKLKILFLQIILTNLNGGCRVPVAAALGAAGDLPSDLRDLVDPDDDRVLEAGSLAQRCRDCTLLKKKSI
jgi:hypothetical protein